MKKIILVISVFLISILSCMNSKQSKAKKNCPPQDYFEGKDQVMAEAVYKGDVREIETLIKIQKYDVNGRGNKVNAGRLQKFTYLGYAVLVGELKSAEKLLELGADVNAVSFDGGGIWPNINLACSNKNKGMINLLLKYKADLNPSLSSSPLERIIIEDMGKEMVELLISQGADVNHQSYIGGDTSLITALQIRNFEMVDYFLDRGADPMLMDYVGNTFAYLIKKRIEEGIGNDFVQQNYFRIQERLIKDFHVQYPLKNELKIGMELAIQRYEKLVPSDKILLGESEKKRIDTYKESIKKGVSMTGKPFESYNK